MSEKTSDTSYQLPPTSVFNHAAKIAIVEDKPIMLDYWVDSLNSGSGVIYCYFFIIINVKHAE